MSVLRDDEPARDPVAENLFDDLRHLRAGFPGADDDEPSRESESLASDQQHSVFQVKEFSNARGGIRRIQRGFPDQPRRFAKFADSSISDGCALLLVGVLHALADSVAHLLDAGAIWRFGILLEIRVQILEDVVPLLDCLT